MKNHQKTKRKIVKNEQSINHRGNTIAIIDNYKATISKKSTICCAILVLTDIVNGAFKKQKLFSKCLREEQFL